MSATQSVHIEHRRPQPGPLVITHVPPLAADGMNCTLRTSARADLKPGPIESALIPAPRRKGK